MVELEALKEELLIDVSNGLEVILDTVRSILIKRGVDLFHIEKQIAVNETECGEQIVYNNEMTAILEKLITDKITTNTEKELFYGIVNILKFKGKSPVNLPLDKEDFVLVRKYIKRNATYVRMYTK